MIIGPLMNATQSERRRLNTLKDSPRSDKTIKLMKHYTAELKESKMKHEGPHDKLNHMFVPKRGSHRLKSTDQGNGIGCKQSRLT